MPPRDLGDVDARPQALGNDRDLALIGPFTPPLRSGEHLHPPRSLHCSIIAGFKHTFKSIPLEDEIIDDHTGQWNVGRGSAFKLCPLVVPMCCSIPCGETAETALGCMLRIDVQMLNMLTGHA